MREAERPRDKERKAYGAAMTVVGTEVASLKHGRAELATTPSKRRLQVEFLPVPHRRKGIILPAS